MKKYLTIGLILIGTASAWSQTIGANEHSKYWYYRQRLLTEFMVVGEENPVTCDQPSGFSIPAHELRTEGTNPELVKFGEDPINMGWYVAVLATEYDLLKRYGQPTNHTLQELYYALKAFERIDRKCETLFWPYNVNQGCPTGNYNGLMGRDDVYEGFGALANPAFRTRYTQDGILYFESMLQEQRDLPNQPINAYLSPDQTSGILLGCAMVKTYLPADVTVQGLSLRNYAISIAEKVGDRFAAKNWWGRLENGGNYENGRVFRDEFVAYGFAKAFDEIVGKKTSNLSTLGLKVPYYVESLDESKNAQLLGWIGRPDVSVLDPVYYSQDHDFTVAYTLLTAAIGDSWGLSTEGKLYYFGNRYGMEIYHMIFDGLRDSNLSSSRKRDLRERIASHLLSAPGEGPYNRGDGASNGVAGWRSENRYWRSLWAVNGRGGRNQYRYNGLDYMLAYNLLWLLDPGRSTVSDYTYGNILDLNNDIAQAGQGFLLENVYLASRIANSSGTVDINSAQEVRMLPGFVAQNGSNVHVTAEPFSTLTSYRSRTGGTGKSIAKAKHLEAIAAEEALAETLEPQLTIFPNPTEGELVVDTNMPIAHYTVTNMMGITVQQGAFQEHINISSQQSGLYVIRLFDEVGNMLKTEKVVKNN